MDIRQLRYFVTVYEEMSFTKAAKRLFVSQPTLSKAIKNMESELGEPLFDRESSALCLTDVGEALLLKAKTILNEFDSISNAALDLKNLHAGKLVVAIPPLISSLYFAEIISDYKRRYPGVTLLVREVSAPSIFSHVNSGTLDLGVTIQPVSSEEFTVKGLFHGETVAIMRRDHHLARKEYIQFSDLRNEPLNLFSEGFLLYSQTTKQCRDHGFDPIINTTSTQTDFLTYAARAGNGITILPLQALHQIPSDMCWRSFRPKYPWDIVFIWKKDRSLSHAARSFVERAEFHFGRISEKAHGSDSILITV